MRNNSKSILVKSIIMPIVVGSIIACLVWYFRIGGIINTTLFGVLFAIATALFVFGAVKKMSKLVSITFYSLVVSVVILGGYLALEYLGWLEYLSSEENIQQLIGRSSPWGEIIFILITFAQVTLVPIPSTITVIAGVIAFGIGGSILYSTIGLLIGSMFAFALGRIFGMKIVRVTIGEGMYNKYQNIVKGKDVTMLFLMFLLPLFPDDLLCIVAGLTSMSYTQFFIMMLITRPIGVAVTSVGSKLLSYIPLTGWGLVVWGVIIVLVIVLVFLLMKYSNLIQDRMVDFFDRHFNKARQVKGANLNKIDLNKYHFIQESAVYSNIAYYSTYGGANKKINKRKGK